jgi:hypothetical protein
MRARILVNADLRILISAVTFLTLLLILLAPDGYPRYRVYGSRVDSCTIASVKSFITKARRRGRDWSPMAAIESPMQTTVARVIGQTAMG